MFLRAALPLATMWKHIYKPGNGLSSGTGALILDFPESRTVINIFLLFVDGAVYAVCYSSPNKLTQDPIHMVSFKLHDCPRDYF
jgi:hypothetical protein